MFGGSVLVKLTKKLLVGAGITGAIVLLTSVAANAQDVDPVQAVTDLGIQLNLLWVIIGAVLVIFMQAGFALVEAGHADQGKHPVLQGFTDLNLWEAWLGDDEPENQELRDQINVVLDYGIDNIKALATVGIRIVAPALGPAPQGKHPRGDHETSPDLLPPTDRCHRG